MGNNNSVDFKDHQTKQDLNLFLNKVKNDNEKLKQRAEAIQESMENKQPKQKLEKFANAYFEADCKCNAPSIVFWLSTRKRAECHEARMNAFLAFMDLADSTIDYGKLSNALDELKQRTEVLNKMEKTNRRYVEEI